MRLIYNTPNNNFDIVKVVSVNCRDLKFNNTEFNQLVETLNLISSVEKKKKFQSYFHSTFFFQTFQAFASQRQPRTKEKTGLGTSHN